VVQGVRLTDIEMGPAILQGGIVKQAAHKQGAGSRGLEPSADPDGLYQSLLAATLDPVVVIDLSGEVVFASNSVERVFGYRAEELVGQNVKVLMPDPHRAQHDEYLEVYRRTGETSILGRTRLFEVLRKDGSRLDCELSVARVELGAEREPLFIGSFRDVSARLAAERAARSSERRLQVVFDSSFEYLGLLSTEGVVLEMNQAALDATGIQRADAVGKHFWDTRWWAVSQEEREKLKRAVKRAAKGEFVRFETRHLGRDGELLAVDFSLSPVPDDDGHVTLLVPEGRDITAVKRAQAAETSMLRSLAAIGESASILAHEIKNPITSINLALRAVADSLGEDHRVVIEDLVSRMQRLERVMRRTLSFTRPVALKVQACDGAALLRGAIQDLRPAIEAAQVRVELAGDESELPFRADPQLIGEVLSNLVNNSLEAIHDHIGSRISAGVELRDGAIHYRVEDDGPGIPEGQRELVFKPFHTTKSSGTGLGLAFCRKVVEAHGGTLAIERSALGGACFRLELPQQPEES